MHNGRRTSEAFLWSNCLKAPFWGMYALLVFILAKDLNASSLQITCLIALKPAVSLFSPYWSALIHNRPDRLRSNVMFASLIGHAPFFFFPFFSHPWFVVGAGALFLMMKRGIIPAWMEILKRNLPQDKQQKTFSYGSALSYLGGSILPICFGLWMDRDAFAWKLLFPVTSGLSLLANLFLLRLPTAKAPEHKTPFSLKASLLRPWKNAYSLLKARSDFIRYQVGFMLGGGGLMIMQPALPPLFLGELHLSYTALATALATCKGIGFSLTSRIWAGWMDRLGIYRFSALVTLLAALFPALLLLGKFQLSWVYIAYLIYGVMQAGSELSWHLSGPLFAKDEDSSVYSSVNVVAVGLRGTIAPFLGAKLCGASSPALVLLLGSAFCIIAAVHLQTSYRKESLTKL
jgi:predicted MFS family arabinose efflux permease